MKGPELIDRNGWTGMGEPAWVNRNRGNGREEWEWNGPGGGLEMSDRNLRVVIRVPDTGNGIGGPKRVDWDWRTGIYWSTFNGSQ